MPEPKAALSALPTAVHGPYEDLVLAVLDIVKLAMQDAPPEVKQKVWDDWLKWHERQEKVWERLGSRFGRKKEEAAP